MTLIWKRPCFGGLTFKNRGQLGSRFVSGAFPDDGFIHLFAAVMFLHGDIFFPKPGFEFWPKLEGLSEVFPSHSSCRFFEWNFGSDGNSRLPLLFTVSAMCCGRSPYWAHSYTRGKLIKRSATEMANAGSWFEKSVILEGGVVHINLAKKRRTCPLLSMTVGWGSARAEVLSRMIERPLGKTSHTSAGYHCRIFWMCQLDKKPALNDKPGKRIRTPTRIKWRPWKGADKMDAPLKTNGWIPKITILERRYILKNHHFWYIC